MVLAVEQRRFQVHHGIARQPSTTDRFQKPLLYGRDVLAWDTAANDAVFELEPRAARQRRELDVNVAELSMSTRLPLVAAMRVDGSADSLTIGHPRNVGFQPNPKLAAHAFQADAHMRLAQAGQDRLGRFIVSVRLERGILLPPGVPGPCPSCPGRPSSLD